MAVLDLLLQPSISYRIFQDSDDLPLVASSTASRISFVSVIVAG